MRLPMDKKKIKVTSEWQSALTIDAVYCLLHVVHGVTARIASVWKNDKHALSSPLQS